jgi:ABC-type uncharacterized transport system permease subunit
MIALAARFPLLPGTRLHAGILLALAGAAALWYLFGRTLWGRRGRHGPHGGAKRPIDTARGRAALPAPAVAGLATAWR